MVRNNISIENARLIFRNFSGKETKFNPAGRRNFCVVLDDSDLVHRLEEDGWNVRYLQPRNEGEDPQPYLQVSVGFGSIPPQIVLITGNRKTNLLEEDVSMLDWAEIENVDLIIRPYNWDVGGRGGVKAYLKTMYVTIVEDEFERKYRDLDEN